MRVGVDVEGASTTRSAATDPGTGAGNLISGNGRRRLLLDTARERRCRQPDRHRHHRHRRAAQRRRVWLDRTAAIEQHDRRHGRRRGNVISGNTMTASRSGSTATGNVIAGNQIGTDITGTVALPNATGVALDPAPRQHDRRYGHRRGQYDRVQYRRCSERGTGTGNAILENLIFANGSGIVLASGGNNNQIAPVITGVTSEATVRRPPRRRSRWI